MTLNRMGVSIRRLHGSLISWSILPKLQSCVMSVTCELASTLRAVHASTLSHVAPDTLKLSKNSPPESRECAMSGSEVVARVKIASSTVSFTATPPRPSRSISVNPGDINGTSADAADIGETQTSSWSEEEESEPEASGKDLEGDQRDGGQVITFTRTVENNEQKDAFMPLPVEKVKSTRSALSQMLNRSSLGEDDDVVDETLPFLAMQVFFPFLEEKEDPIFLKVRDDSTVESCIVAILRAYRKEKRATPLLMNAAAYHLMVAESDGNPDYDFPPLVRTSLAARFRCETYALVLNQQAKALTANISAASPPAAASAEAPPQRKESAQLKKTGDGKGNYFVKIIFPDRTSFNMPISPDVLVRDLLIIVSEKYDMNPSEWVFHYASPGGDHHGDNRLVSLDQTLQAAKLDEVLLQPRDGRSRKGRSVSVLSSSSQDADRTHFFFFSDSTAAVYKEWPVLKINRYNSRQERVLGIDGDRLYNMMTKSQGGKKPKRGARLIRDVTAVSLGEKLPPPAGNSTPTSRKGKAFTVSFGDNKTLYYETNTEEDAAEIVAKLKHLVEMRGGGFNT